MRLVIGTSPVQVLAPNPKRTKLEIQFVPSSIESGNTGNIFLAIGHPPGTALSKLTYDEVLNAGASVVKNKDSGDSDREVKSAIWLVSDTTSQVVMISEDIAE